MKGALAIEERRVGMWIAPLRPKRSEVVQPVGAVETLTVARPVIGQLHAPRWMAPAVGPINSRCIIGQQCVAVLGCDSKSQALNAAAKLQGVRLFQVLLSDQSLPSPLRSAGDSEPPKHKPQD